MAAALVANYGGSSSESESEEEETSTAEARRETSVPEETVGVNFLTSTNTESDDEDSDSDNKVKPKDNVKGTSSASPVDKLPLPSFMTQETYTFSSPATTTSTSKSKSLATYSVFTNPFEKAEKQKLSILEQHVKLSSAEKTEAEMGKKICWMYRKGRCRFGHKCKFAHDNDIGLKQPTQENEDKTNQAAAPAIAPGFGGQHFAQPFQYADFDTGAGLGRREQQDDEDRLDFQQRKRKKPGLAQGLVPPKKSMTAYQRQTAQERPWTTRK